MAIDERTKAEMAAEFGLLSAAYDAREQREMAEAAKAAYSPQAHWHVAIIAERQVRDVVLALDRRRTACYRPEMVVTESMASRRQRYAQVPMFPGYLFVHFDLSVAGWAWLSRVDGILGFLGEDRPAEVPDSVIDAVMDVELALARVRRCRRLLAGFPFQRGERVEIVRNALAANCGHRLLGEIARLDPRGRITVLLDAVMGRAVEVTVDPSQIRAA